MAKFYQTEDNLIDQSENKTADTINADVRSMQHLALPEYLVFLILGHIRELREIAPDHVLVKAVQDALPDDDTDAPEQLELF